MNLGNPMFFIPALIGVIFMVMGLISRWFPPKKINNFYGYRTKGSMRNQERWDFAQEHASKGFIRLGAVLALAGIPGLFLSVSPGSGVGVGLGLMVIMVVILISRTERAIADRFDDS